MRIAVNGAAGAMGKRVIVAAVQSEDCDVVAALESPGHPDLAKDAGIGAGVEPLGIAISSELTGDPEVLVDFSVPAATLGRARECAEAGVAVLIGTTGLSAEQRSEIEDEVAARVPVLIAPNMSVGINALYDLVERAAEVLGQGYDVEVIEAHHRRKKDAPSGTAMELARRLCAALEREPETVLLYGRQGQVGQRTGQEIAVHAVRGGDIVGDHTVLFAGPGERIELTHRASSREVFARGAIRAARFLQGRAPGLYAMRDVLRSAEG